MPSPLTVWPSTDKDALVKAITDANRDNRRIVLMPGIHLTKPGHMQRIPICKNGLHIRGIFLGPILNSIIKRPDKAIDLAHTDGNYGLFFIPSAPTIEEWRSVSEWKTHTTVDRKTGKIKTFDYAVIVRGKIIIEYIELDCNMGNQCLPKTMPSKDIEHSAMLAFAGNEYKNSSFPGKIIYVGFESVTLNNIKTTRGGYADDIWISRGYFRPNIGKVSIKKITSQSRINDERSTITFSGLTQNVEITDANIFSLQAEVTSGGNWKELPGEALNETNQYSYWQLKNIVCQSIDLAAKGHGIFLNADHIESTKSTYLYQLGGLIKNCTFNVLPESRTLNRLNALTFKKVTWIFTANTEGTFIGIAIRPQYGEPCSATFIKNIFRVNGDLITDAETEQHCLIETKYLAVTGNAVTLEFRNCTYDDRFGREDKAYIAKVISRGQWKFKISDFMGIPVDRVLFIRSTATRRINAGYVEISIP